MSLEKANKDMIRKEIAELINKIKEQSDRFGNQKDIPLAELDVIVQQVAELHRKVVVWQYLNELPDLGGASTERSRSARSDNVKQPEAVEEVETITNVKAQDELQEVSLTAIPNEESLSNRAEPRVDNTEPRVDNTGNGELGTGSRPEGLFTNKPGTENLRDLQSFIGFNEKLMYIRQVFRGNHVAYDEAVKVINAMRSMNEAHPFLEYLAEEFKWTKDNEPVGIFKETVKRRFS